MEKKWIHISLISNIGQLSLETYSKTYGRGMLKIEPRSLKEALTLRKHDPVINEIYDEVQILLKANNKAKASEVATNFISKYLELPIEFKKKIDPQAEIGSVQKSSVFFLAKFHRFIKIMEPARRAGNHWNLIFYTS